MDFKIDRDELAESLHTGLRKGCDSTWSSLMWSAIYLVDEEIWGWFLDILHQNFERHDVSTETIKYVFTEFGSMSIWNMHDKLGTEREYREYLDKHRDDPLHSRHTTVFICALNMIDDDGAESLYRWFEYIHNYEEKIKAS